MSFKSLLITYLVGGLTLPPLLILLVLYILFTTLPKYIEDDEKETDFSDLETEEYKNLKLTEIEERESSGVKAYKTGWITVTREYHTFVSNANDKQLEQPTTENKSAYTALYKLVKNNKKDQNNEEGASSPTPGTPANQNLTQKVRRKNRFYGVLRHGNLFLYKDETRKDVQHVIVLSNNIVTIWPRGTIDGELFTKRNSICLLKKSPRRKSDSPPKHSSASLSDTEQDDATADILETGIIPPKHMAFFIYVDGNYDKEDWYFELIKATKRPGSEPTGTEFDKYDPSIYANALHFKTSDMISLIQTLHSSEGQLQTRWLNAIIGRVFLSLQDTEYFENYVKSRLLSKLAKINKPGFLDDFKVQKINVGDSAPLISFPKLQDIKPDGSLRVSFKFTYTGKLSMQVATKANINLGSRFKTREFTILLAVTVNKIEGPLVISIKPPPSTRLWYTFERMPEIDLTVEPVVSQRQIKYSMITKVIENKLRDSIRETLVEPSWDDITFFKTSDEFYRGGIWDTKKRPPPETYHPEEPVISDSDIDLDEAAILDDVDSTLLNSDGTLANDFNPSDDDDRSIKSKATSTLKSRHSFSGSISSLNKRKSTASISTSNEQFLSDGSFVSRELTSPTKEEKEKTFSKSSTMQIISEEAIAGKKTISSSLKKLGRWYNDKTREGSSPNVSKDAVYKPPEMISRRREPSGSSDTPKQVKREPSVGDLISIDSTETSGTSPVQRAAPQPHNFPAEYLYGLETHKPDEETETKNVPPTRIADMKSPYFNEGGFGNGNSTNSLPKKVPRRKPVEEEGDTVDPFDIILSQENEKLSRKEVDPTEPTEPEVEEPITVSRNIVEQVALREITPSSSSLPVALGAPPAIPARKPPQLPERNLSKTPSIQETSIIPPALPPRESPAKAESPALSGIRSEVAGAEPVDVEETKSQPDNSGEVEVNETVVTEESVYVGHPAANIENVLQQ